MYIKFYPQAHYVVTSDPVPDAVLATVGTCFRRTSWSGDRLGHVTLHIEGWRVWRISPTTGRSSWQEYFFRPADMPRKDWRKVLAFLQEIEPSVPLLTLDELIDQLQTAPAEVVRWAISQEQDADLRLCLLEKPQAA